MLQFYVLLKYFNMTGVLFFKLLKKIILLFYLSFFLFVTDLFSDTAQDYRGVLRIIKRKGRLIKMSKWLSLIQC